MSWGRLQQTWQVTFFEEVCADLVGLWHALEGVMPECSDRMGFNAIRWVCGELADRQSPRSKIDSCVHRAKCGIPLIHSSASLQMLQNAWW